LCIRGFFSGLRNANPTVIPSSQRLVTPAKRTRTMKASLVFAGAVSTGPHLRIRSVKRWNISRAFGPFPSKNFSIEYGPHACHMLGEISFAPHFGHVHNGCWCRGFFMLNSKFSKPKRFTSERFSSKERLLNMPFDKLNFIETTLLFDFLWQV
jgi:hypothetical protein